MVTYAPISSRPTANPLTGEEQVLINQAGTTKRTTSGAISALPFGSAGTAASGIDFITVSSASAALPSSRTLAATSPVTLTDGGAGGALTIGLSFTPGTGTVTSVGLDGGTTGLTISNSPITTSGTMTLGGVLNVSNGGVGTSNLTAHGVLIGNGTGAVAITVAGSLNLPLVGRGVGADPAFFMLPVPGGGTGTTTIAANRILIGDTVGSSIASVANATSGYVLTSTGAGSAPTFQAAGAGAGTVTSIATGFGLTGGTITTTGTVSISTTAPPYGFDMPVNLGLSASSVASALTLSITDATGATPSATSPVLMPFRSATGSIGIPTWRSVTGATSVTVPQTATVGTLNGVPFKFWITGHDTGTSVILGLINCASTGTLYQLPEYATKNTVAITTAAATAGIFYASGTTTSRPFRILGFAEYGGGLTTAGVYASVPTTLQLSGPGVPRPGQTIQAVQTTTSSVTINTGTSFVDTNLSASITPLSASNYVSTVWFGETQSGVAGQPVITALRRGGTVIGPPKASNSDAANIIACTGQPWLDSPNSTASLTYTVAIRVFASGTASFPNAAGGGVLQLAEVMG